MSYSRCISSEDRGSQLPVSVFKTPMTIQVGCKQHTQNYLASKFKVVNTKIILNFIIKRTALIKLIN